MKHLFSTRVRVVLIIVVLLAIILAVVGNLQMLRGPNEDHQHKQVFCQVASH